MKYQLILLVISSTNQRDVDGILAVFQGRYTHGGAKPPPKELTKRGNFG